MNVVRPGSESTAIEPRGVDDDLARGRQAWPRSRADVLRGEERVEHARGLVGGDARAVAGYRPGAAKLRVVR
jgi:hypothetical protein